jgi:hypothetical protein
MHVGLLVSDFVRKTRAIAARMAIKATHPDYDAAAPAWTRAHGSQPSTPSALALNPSQVGSFRRKGRSQPVKLNSQLPDNPLGLRPIENQKSKIKNRPTLTNFIPVLHTNGGARQKQAARRRGGSPGSDKTPIKNEK